MFKTILQIFMPRQKDWQIFNLRETLDRLATLEKTGQIYLFSLI